MSEKCYSQHKSTYAIWREREGGLVHKVMEMNRNEVVGEWADGTKASEGIQPSASLKIEGEQSDHYRFRDHPERRMQGDRTCITV